VGEGAGTQPLPMTPLPRAAKVLMSVIKLMELPEKVILQSEAACDCLKR
jgi:hypothetical protein